ncbi:MAG: Bifunctional phosphoglucose/phosphomannose isomerase, partial [Parcubacteria group bacterium GW2011_GWC2_42_6]
TAELLKKFGWNCELIKIKSNNPLEKMFWSLTFGDWLAYKLAMAYGIDPTPVNLVEELKAQMKD